MSLGRMFIHLFSHLIFFSYQNSAGSCVVRPSGFQTKGLEDRGVVLQSFLFTAIAVPCFCFPFTVGVPRTFGAFPVL